MHRNFKHMLQVFAIIAMVLLIALVVPPKAAQAVENCNAGVDIVPGTLTYSLPAYNYVVFNVNVTNTTSVTCIVQVTFYLDVTYTPTGKTRRISETTLAALPPLGAAYNNDGVVTVGVAGQFIDVSFTNWSLFTTSVPSDAVELRKFNPRCPSGGC